MKAIILASGKGTRMRPLTDTTPKPLIKIAGRPIIEHNIEKIYAAVDEIIIVVKYLSEQFETYFWDNYKGTKISYHIQGEEKGTGAALYWINIQDDIILLYGDSIFEQSDLDSILNLDGYGCLVKNVDQPEKYGIFVQKSDGSAEKVVEKPTEDYGNLANVWVYKFSKIIFTLVDSIELSERWEYELTDAINLFCESETFQLIEMKGEFVDIWYPWQILAANSYFLDQFTESKIEWTVEDWVTIKWNIILKKWAVLKSGTYIEGNCIIWENTVIGPNAYIRWNTVIGNNSKAGNAVEIKNSSLWDTTVIAHLNYIWDSIIWNNVNIWWWVITANLRHDNKNMRCMIDGKLVDTWLRNLWAIIGDGAHLWIHTSIYPARVIETNGTTLPWEIIK